MILNAIAEKLKRQSKDDFKGRHFEAWLIVQAVAWYLRYPLSYRNLEEMFRERGFEVDHSTINRWVLAYAPMIEKRLRQFRRPHCGSVRIDETYVKIRGRWRYLYRAIDKHGSPVDFLLTAKRDLDAAKRFFRKMLKEEPLLCHQTSAARHRERPFQSEEEHAEDRRLSILPNGAADDRGFRSDVVAAERLRLRRRLDRQRSERSARAPLRTSKG